MKDFGDFLDEIMRETKTTNLTLSEWVTAYGIDIGQNAIAKYRNNDRTPTPNMIKAIARYFNISEQYFFTGLEHIVKLPVSYRPLIGSASCGVPTTYYYDDVEMISAPEGVGEHTYYIRADGDSMTPRINHGDLLLCDMDNPGESGDIVHFEWDGMHGVKRYVIQGEVRMMLSFNDAYPPIIITDEYELRTAKVIMRQEFL